jgi:O-antigen ligase
VSVYRAAKGEAAIARYRENLILFGAAIAAGIVCAVLVALTGHYAAIAAGGLLFAALSFRRIDLALTLVVLISGVLFISLYSFRFWQFHISEVMVPIMVIVIWLKRLTIPGRRIVWDRIFWVLLGLIGITVFSWIHSYLFWGEGIPTFHRKILTQVSRVALVMLAATVPIVIANTIEDWKQLKRVYRALVWAALIAGLIAITYFIASPDRANWPFSAKIPMPTVGAILLPMVFAQALAGEDRRTRRLGGIAIFLILVAMVLRLKQTTYISTLAGILVMAYIARRRFFWGFVIASGAVLLAFGRAIYHVLEIVAERAGSLQRPEVWSNALLIFKDNWLFGVGPANFYQQYLARWPETVAGLASNAHNEYLQVGCEIGIFGLLLTGIIVVWTIVNAWRLFKETSNGFCRMFAVGVLGCFVAMPINVFFNNWLLMINLVDFPYTMYYWVIIGMLWVTKRLDERDRGVWTPAATGSTAPLGMTAGALGARRFSPQTAGARGGGRR